MTKITADTPLSEVFEAQFAIMTAQASGAGYPKIDIISTCPGMAFTKAVIDKQPDATMADFVQELLAAKDENVGEWVAIFLKDQWDDIYPEYKDQMIPLVKGSQCVSLIKSARSKIAEKDMVILRENYRAVHGNTDEIDQ